MIRAWLQRRKEEREKRAFENGYGWAMLTYFHRGWPVEAIVDSICHDDINPAFDNGVRAAARKLDEMEMANGHEPLYH